LVDCGADGSYLRDTAIPSNVRKVTALGNGNMVVLKGRPDQALGQVRFPVLLCDAGFPDLKVLSPGRSMPIFAQAGSINGLDLRLDYEGWQVSGDRIYVSDSEGGYDISVYDFDGNPSLIISKEYSPVPVPLKVIARQGRIYYLREKGNGYKELAVGELRSI
jgi:hypothetical protein